MLVAAKVDNTRKIKRRKDNDHLRGIRNGDDNLCPSGSLSRQRDKDVSPCVDTSVVSAASNERIKEPCGMFIGVVLQVKRRKYLCYTKKIGSVVWGFRKRCRGVDNSQLYVSRRNWDVVTLTHRCLLRDGLYHDLQAYTFPSPQPLKFSFCTTSHTRKCSLQSMTRITTTAALSLT